MNSFVVDGRRFDAPTIVTWVELPSPICALYQKEFGPFAEGRTEALFHFGDGRWPIPGQSIRPCAIAIGRGESWRKGRLPPPPAIGGKKLAIGLTTYHSRLVTIYG